MFSDIFLVYTFYHVTNVKSENLQKSILILLYLKQENEFLNFYPYSAKLEFYRKNIFLTSCYFP
jgi:hypothetical protein